ncbi:hypothetical protein JET14_22470 (plasmid) [Martelella lutilitoris]|uniref:Uncharacterized protein n=1 Tax=Martelella lutilitoris TaxID=2583532 RepID=A0A7T7KPH4_9HYPH|nr:hypothetical protein JET14_22470 [Martelella lutilitoris]
MILLGNRGTDLRRRFEQEQQIASRVIDGLARDCAVARRLGQYERALQHGLAARGQAVLQGVQSAAIPRAFIAAAMSGSSVAACPKMPAAQASRIAGFDP